MANTSSRALRLLSLLQTNRSWTGDELAERLDVSARTLRRDVDRLRELGYPVEAHRGVDGGYQLTPGVALPPLGVDDDEAVALALGLYAATQGSVAGVAESSVSALTKLAAVLPKRSRHRLDALRATALPAVPPGDSAGVDAGSLTTLAQACRECDRVEFGYTDAAGTGTERHVEPHRLVSLGQRWYLVAYDLTRHDWRSFRFDRITRTHRTGVRFRPRELPAADAVAFVRAGIEERFDVYQVEVVVHAPAEPVRSRIGQWARVTEVTDTTCRVTMSTDALDWPTMALGSLGADFEIISPVELVEYVREWAVRFNRATGPAE